MRPRARQPFGTRPVSGARIDERRAIATRATLHVDAAEARSVEVADLTPRGCRIALANDPAANDLAVATYVSLMLAGVTLISGRIAWNDGTALGIDFCMPLLPRIVARLTG